MTASLLFLVFPCISFGELGLVQKEVQPDRDNETANADYAADREGTISVVEGDSMVTFA